MAIRSSDQISIVDLTDGYSVMLTNDSHTFLGDTSKAIAASTQTTVIAMCGASQVAASVNLDDVVKPTGVNVTKDTDATQPTLTIAVTTAVTAGGVVDIPIQLDNGNITIHKLFTFQIAFKGQTGAAGSSAQWYTGTKITGTSTTATIFSDSGITAAKVGDMYLNTSTQNLTLANGTTTGAKNCYYSGATRLTTHYAAGNAIHLTYRVNANVNGTNYTGWWADANYDSNYYDRIRFNNVIKAKTAISASYLIVGDSGGYFHLAAGSIFDVDKPILWAASAITASATATTNYLSYPSCTLRNNAGSTWAATQYATLYLAGALIGNSFVVASENWLTTAPANESLTYIALGYMYSTYQMYFYPEHPMYRLVDDVLTAVSQMAYEAQVAASTAQATADAARADFRRVVRIDNDGLHVGDNQSTGEVLIDSESVNVVMNGSKYSRFAGNYVQFGNYQLRRTTDGGLAFKMTDI